MTLSCSHPFCRQCIATHAARQARHEQPASCPLCKGHLTEAEIQGCGPARELQEESDDEEEQPVLIIMEFDGEDGEEAGFWLMMEDDDTDDSSEEGYESGGQEDEEVDEDEGDEMRAGAITGEFTKANDTDEEVSEEGGEDFDKESGEGFDEEGDESEALKAVDQAKRSTLLEGFNAELISDDDNDQEVEQEHGQQHVGMRGMHGDDALLWDRNNADEAENDSQPYGGWRWSVSHHAWVGNSSVTGPPPRVPPSQAFDGPDPLAGQQITGILAINAELTETTEDDAEGDD